MLSLSLPSRALALRSLLSIPTSPSNVLARHFTGATVPTRRDTDPVDSAQATNDNSMDQITDILDDADLSTSLDLTASVVSPCGLREPTLLT